MKSVYTLLDTKSGIPTPPFLAENDAVAARTVFLSLRKSGDIPPVLFPDDFALIRIGDWTERGERPLVVLDVPVSVGSVRSIINSLSEVNKSAEDSDKQEGKSDE